MDYFGFAKRNARLQNLAIRLQHMGREDLIEEFAEQAEKEEEICVEPVCVECGEILTEEEEEELGNQCQRCFDKEVWQDDHRHPDDVPGWSERGYL